MIRSARTLVAVSLLTLIGTLLCLTSSAVGVDLNDGRIYYKTGTRIEFPNSDIRLNVQLQPRYSYEDLDLGNRENAGFLSDAEDSSSFDMRRARFIATGNALDKQFSYKVEQDFADNDGGGDLQDAWIQWNGNPAKIRFGQFKQPIGREERIHSTRLFFTERSVVNDTFVIGRNQGAMLHGNLSETMHWYAAINNGESDNEGQNQEGQDNKVQGVLSLDFSSLDFGGRGTQGDFRDNGSFALTAGLAAAYGEGSVEDDDFEEFDLTADLGMRFQGLEMSGEFFYNSADLDSKTGPESDSLDNLGFVLDASYVMNKKVGFGLRFGFIEPDNSVTDQSRIENVYEYTLVVNYFINDHYLKLQNGLTFQSTELQNSSDVDDLRYDLQLAGYF